MNSIFGLLFRDIADKNELKKTAVATRCCCLLMVIYSVIFAVTSLLAGSLHGIVVVLIMAAGYIISMVMTYGKSVQRACLAVDVVTLLGISTTVIWFGWNSGIQHFLFALVLFNILFVRMSVVRQMFSAFGICAVRLLLYFYCRYSAPRFEFDATNTVFIQIVSTIFVFMIIVACGVNYAIENQNTENALMKYNKELKQIASTDPLTKLWNRYRLLEHVKDYLANSSGAFCSVCLCDIDFFKKINDTYGHEAGDKVLEKLAEVFKEAMNADGAVARWGGEEFLLFWEGHNGDEAHIKLSDIRYAIKKMVIPYDDKEISITMTFGLVEYDRELNIDENIKIADERLYIGKQQGRDQIVY